MVSSRGIGGGVVAILLVAFVPFVSSCASPAPSPESKPAFQTEPSAPYPRIEISWRRLLDDPAVVDYRARQYAAPVVEGVADQRALLVGTDDGRVYRLRAGDGEVRWETKLDGSIHARPVPSRNRVYVGTSTGIFYALERSSGSVVWKLENDREIESAAAVGDGIVFYSTNAGNLVAVDESSGEKAWTYERSIPKEFTIKGSGSPVVSEQTVFCGFADGTVAALDTRSGRKNWVADVSGGGTDFSDVDEPVIIRNGRVFATSYGSGVTALDRETGTAIWSRKFENVATTAYAEETLYLAIASGRVVAIRSTDGASKWGFSMEDSLPVQIVPTSGYAFVSTSNGPLYVLDRATGYPLLKWKPSTGVNTAVAFSDRAGYLFSNKGYLYQFRVAY